ncbi:MAG: fumarate reductase cytochrome b subunit [Planctomycetota bacterium]|nr:fumarate reductase cytochrome b subunit [Planctomycetota bacterium]
MKSLLDDQVRKSRVPARLDWWQSATGLLLGLFMWTHLLLVSSILISKDAMLYVTRLLEGSTNPSEEGGHPILVSGAAIAIFVLFVVHAGLAMRKFPANWKQWRTMRSHMKMMKHGETSQWWVQAVTGFIMFFLGSAHLIIIASNADKIGPGLSSDRFWSWGLWPLYLILLLAVEVHGAIGLYRLVIKWGIFDGKDPRATRRRLKKIKTGLTIFFITLGLLSFAAYVKIGMERAENGQVGQRYGSEGGEDH